MRRKLLPILGLAVGLGWLGIATARAQAREGRVWIWPATLVAVQGQTPRAYPVTLFNPSLTSVRVIGPAVCGCSPWSGPSVTLAPLSFARLDVRAAGERYAPGEYEPTYDMTLQEGARLTALSLPTKLRIEKIP